MGSPFPGVDPYLEHPDLWPTVHYCLIGAVADALRPLVRPRYWVAVEERAYLAEPEEARLVGVPDVSVAAVDPAAPRSAAGTATLERAVEVGVPVPEAALQRYLEIRVPITGEVVTVIETLSPTSKRPDPRQEEYLRKREAVLSARTNLVEIDLLRSGPRMPTLLAPDLYHYGVLVARGEAPDRAVLYPNRLQEPLPRFPVPLRPGEEDVWVDLGQVLHSAYDRGDFALVLDYRRLPEPPLSPEEQRWAEQLLREKGLAG